MNFTFDNQGSSSFIIYTLSGTDELDDIGLGMINNNKINGIIPVSYMQINDERLLRYNISSKIPLESLLGSIVSREKVLAIFASICDVLVEAEEYLLETGMFILDKQYIYSNVSSGECVLMYLPIMKEDEEVDLRRFFKELIFSVQSDSSGNTDYVARMINVLNKPGNFDLINFRNTVHELKRNHSGNRSGFASGKSAAYRRTASAHSVDQSGFASSGQSAPDSRSAFSSHETNGSVKYGSADLIDNRNVGSYSAADSQPAHIQNQVQDQKENAFAAAQSGTDTSQQEEKKGLFGLSFGNKKSEEEKKSKFGALFRFGREEEEDAPSESFSDLGFDVPGMEKKADAIIKPEIPSPSYEPRKEFPVSQSVPKESGQKKEPAVQPGSPVRGNNYRQNPYSGHTPVQRQPDPQQWDDVTANRYAGGGGTTVLNQYMHNDGTTMLSPNMLSDYGEDKYVPSGYLRREKTGEEIRIDGNVFHIGRERSFVNYFIPDNPTISKSHADVINREGKFYLKDTNSKNHTYINGQMLTSNQEYEIQNGDTVMFANEKYEFRIK